MASLDEVARAALARDALAVRSLVQDLLRERPSISDWEAPHDVSDPGLLALAAALAELLADRCGQAAPPWTAKVGPLPEPFFLLRSAETMKNLRMQCEAESPPPLRKRRLYAPANFLEFA
ncbi:MAG: hypothetical protein FJZ01_00395 [Candidatus Sericytochromatia bacterium]|nr:hypothetical protein [Candidatus Tanganyikabacteria bacterium]